MNKRLSRQRRWQIRMETEGRCVQCGGPRGESRARSRCAPCYERLLARARWRYKHDHAYRAHAQARMRAYRPRYYAKNRLIFLMYASLWYLMRRDEARS